MNRARHRRLERILESLTGTADELAEIGDEEREAFESMPNGVQQSEQGCRAEAIADAIDGAVAEISQAVDSVRDAHG